MKTRIITSVVGIALLAVVLGFFHTLAFNLIFLAAALLAIYEVYLAFDFGKGNLYLYLGFVPLTAAVMLSDWYPARILLFPVVYLFALYLAICVIRSSNTVNFQKLGGLTIFAAIILACFYSFVYLKAFFPRAEYGYDAVYFMLLALGYAWGGDTTAYFVGRTFGKRKLAPVISPHKTVEGAIGGLLGSMVIGLLISIIYVQGLGRLLLLDRVRFAYYPFIALLGIVAGMLGIVGDLFASAVKRQCGIKDYGSIFPGHGGILDRFDSVLFVAPLVSMVVTMGFYNLRLPL